jgi:hypothetical protein
MRDDEAKKQLKNLSESIANLRGITKNITLSGDYATLPNISCRAVEILNNENDLIAKTDDGADYTAATIQTLFIYTSNASKISVKGTGVLSYIIIK